MVHVSYAVLDGNLIINVPFALTTHRDKFSCNENQKIEQIVKGKIGQIVPGKPGAIMLLSDIPAGLVIQNDKSLFFELDEYDLVHAKLKIFGALENRVMKRVNVNFFFLSLCF